MIRSLKDIISNRSSCFQTKHHARKVNSCYLNGIFACQLGFSICSVRVLLFSVNGSITVDQLERQDFTPSA